MEEKLEVKETKVVSYDPQEVKIIDIKMPFFSMVMFMIKWALASIPAIIIFFTIMGLLSALIAPWYHPIVVTY